MVVERRRVDGCRGCGWSLAFPCVFYHGGALRVVVEGEDEDGEKGKEEMAAIKMMIRWKRTKKARTKRKKER